MDSTTYNFNNLQSDLNTFKPNKETRVTIYEYIESIRFIKNLVDKNRRYAKDLKRYTNPYLEEEFLEENNISGKIKVDFANPHILEDMSYFKKAALSYERTGRYTHLMPSKNPYSDYKKFWDEETRRCWNGYVRESDGEWITGYHYFYLNYAKILQSKTKKGSKRADRVYLSPKIYDGDYLFFHYMEYARERGKHTVTLKKRGAGYSYKAGGKLARNFILGENENACKEVNSFAIANEKEYLVKDGVLNKFLSIIDHVADNTPWPRRRELASSFQEMRWTMGYKDKLKDINRGTLNSVFGVTLKNDAEKARGKRGVLIEWEEFGKFDNALKAWTIGRPSVEDDQAFAFGQMCAYGTGGTEGAAFEGLREIFYFPEAYNVQPLENVYDKNTKPGSTCGYFHPAYLNSADCFDENGNSDVIKALFYLVSQRVITKYSAKDPTTLSQLIAEYPITPQEAVMEIAGNIFPKVEIMERLENARINYASFTSDILVGEFALINNSEVRFINNPDLVPLRKYNGSNTNSFGAIEIFKTPEENNSGWRYIAGIDPIDDDYKVKGSLGSIIIFDLFTDQIVAEYTGRPYLAEDFYENCRRLLIYYNAQALYESNIKGLFGYFNYKNCLHLLADTPQYLRDIQEIKGSLGGNTSKGVRVTAGIIAEGLRLQRSWMLKEYIDNENLDENDNPRKLIMLDTVKSLAYLEETYQYNPDANFDRISAMNQVMILRKERLKYLESYTNQDKYKYKEEDSFISKNWDNKFSIYNDDEVPEEIILNDKIKNLSDHYVTTLSKTEETQR